MRKYFCHNRIDFPLYLIDKFSLNVRRVRLESEPHDIMGNILPDRKKTHFQHRTMRHTDLMNPEYHVNGMDYRDDSSTKPKKPKGEIHDSHLLRTDDIPGATAGWKPADIQRREYRNTNYIGDIEGAHADSIRPGITTNRVTHPLNPVYQALDPGELLLPLIPPLLPPSMVKIPTIPRGGEVKTQSSTAAKHGTDYDKGNTPMHNPQTILLNAL